MSTCALCSWLQYEIDTMKADYEARRHYLQSVVRRVLVRHQRMCHGLAKALEAK